MIEIPRYTAEGQPGGGVSLDTAPLGQEVNLPLLRQVLRAYEANRRQGTRHVKNRGEVDASTRKLYRQKHTGNARAGSRGSNIRRKGGKAHAPLGKDWSQGIPRRVRRAATRQALLARLQDNEVSVVDALALDAPKTSVVAKILKDMGVRGSCLLVVEGEGAETVWKSARNIARTTVRRAEDVNAYDLLLPDRVVFTRPALDAFMKAHTA
jgi:large subunit ribosomal protein L4